MEISSSVKVKVDSVLFDITVQLTETHLSIVVPNEDGVKAFASLPLNGAQIDRYSFTEMLTKVTAEVCGAGVRFKFAGGHRINGARTVRPTFVFEIPFVKEISSHCTVLTHGWVPISSQLEALKNYMFSGDRTVDITEYYFRRS